MNSFEKKERLGLSASFRIENDSLKQEAKKESSPEKKKTISAFEKRKLHNLKVHRKMPKKQPSSITSLIHPNYSESTLDSMQERMIQLIQEKRPAIQREIEISQPPSLPNKLPR